MATSNFWKQDNFPLFISEYFDGEYITDEETGEELFYSRDWEMDDALKTIDEFNDGLQFYNISLESGYYSGMQVTLKPKEHTEVTDDYSAELWNSERKDEKRIYGDYYDYKYSYSEQKRRENAERRKVEKYCRTALKDLYGFNEYVVVGRFSSGETLYELANNKKSLLKSIANGYTDIKKIA